MLRSLSALSGAARLFTYSCLVTCACIGLCPSPACAGPADQLSFVCRADNDLYSVVEQSWNARPRRFEQAAEAIEAAAEGSGLLVLADGYPETPTVFDAKLLEAARRKRLRLYLEYPA